MTRGVGSVYGFVLIGVISVWPAFPLSGLILPAGLKQSIWGLEEGEFPKRPAAGSTLLAAGA